MLNQVQQDGMHFTMMFFNRLLIYKPNINGRHPELDSGSDMHLMITRIKMLNQVQHDEISSTKRNASAGRTNRAAK